MTPSATKIVGKLQSSPAWREIREDFYQTGYAAPVLSGLSLAVDEMALEAFQASLAPVYPDSLALVAVGGFGRRELFPYSDTDIVILLDREAQTSSLKEPLAEFVRLLWDSGLRLSHSVRTVSECLKLHEQNIELNISLLDRRFIGGDRSVYDKLEERFPAFLEKHRGALCRSLCEQARARHVRYQDTLYHLEPDVKETPGGLRDLHLIHWLRLLQNQTAADPENLQSAKSFIHSLRCFLHYQVQRDQNLLSFDAQEAIAEQPFTSAKTPAAWMREYFRNARSIHREAQRSLNASEQSGGVLLNQLRDWRARVSNSEFTVSRERVFVRNPGQLEADPACIFRLFEFVARHGTPLAADTERRLERCRPVFSAYCERTRGLWPTFAAILSLPNVALALRAMHNTGLLEALLPEWEEISCLVVPDFYHRYTIDEHTLVAFEQLNTLGGKQSGVGARFADLLSEIGSPAVLHFALLFHDTGKGAGHNHAARSAELARQAGRRLQIPAPDLETAGFLIESHLDLYATMNSRDLNDPATAQLLAGRIGTIERLKMLALITYADVSAVNPGAMTPWRLEQLWRVYDITQHQLLRELETGRIQRLPAELPQAAEFIKGFPVRYLRTHAQGEIEAHMRLREQSRLIGAAVQLERLGGFYRLTVIGRDRPLLFASLTGVLSVFGLNIVKVEAFANDKGLILDTFVFSDPKRTLELNPPEVERLQEMAQKAVLGKLDVPRLVRDRRAPPKPKRHTVAPSIQFDSEACQTATLVEIVAEDRAGLLYDFAEVFASTCCNIDVVLIDTQGHKALDVFYVAHEGGKLPAQLQEKLRNKLLEVCSA